MNGQTCDHCWDAEHKMCLLCLAPLPPGQKCDTGLSYEELRQVKTMSENSVRTENPGLTYTDHLSVVLDSACGNDADIARIARHDQPGPSEKLLLSLMKNRHGSPFEFGYIVFKCEIPLFVIQQMLRHRIGVSYSQWSLRWDAAPPRIYMPALRRPLFPLDYKQSNVRYNKYQSNTPEEHHAVTTEMMCAFEYSYRIYKSLLERNVAQEIARIVLPSAQMSIIHVAFNPRSLMHFLSLRIDDELNMFPSHPQWEVQRVAEVFAKEMQRQWPMTFAAFQQHGRVAP